MKGSKRMDKLRNKGFKPRHVTALSIFIFALLSDQITKLWALSFLGQAGTSYEILPFLDLTLAWNHGVSFSLLSNLGSKSPYILIALSLIISLLTLFWYLREKVNTIAYSLMLILGGAAGNLVDRFRYGAVIDFIYFHYEKFYWPVFNLADTFITIGAGLMLVYMLFFQKEHQVV